ncbi:MAG TPA: glycosyltransferase family 2 protein [Rhizomicrobium sp.]|nr:glycosyltransferase family 2 protein [Rhizomicrobium sp.]
MNSPRQPRVTEVAFTKNEGRFLLEWIAYHRLIGVTDFLIYTNDCEDESPALLDRLQEMGIVAHVPNPRRPDEQPQNAALSAALAHHLVIGADYVLQIDPDEFLVVKSERGAIQDLIAAAPEADVIAVQMRFIGDSGLARLGSGLVVEQLIQSSREDFGQNAIIKSLARNDPRFIKVTANHLPGFDPAQGWIPRIFNADGREIVPESFNRERFRHMPEAYRSMRHAQLNHYCVRTPADFQAKKYRGTAANNDAKLHRQFFDLRNRNDVEDKTILAHAPATKAVMAEWLSDPILAGRNRRCFEAYEGILRKAQMLFES